MEDHLVYAKSSKKRERDQRVADCLALRRSTQVAVDIAKEDFERASVVLGKSVLDSVLAEAAVKVTQTKLSRWAWLLKLLGLFSGRKKVN